MKNRERINILQMYYETTISNNIGIKTKFTEGVSCGLKLALQHFGYDPDKLDNIEYVHNEIMDLKGSE